MSNILYSLALDDNLYIDDDYIYIVYISILLFQYI